MSKLLLVDDDVDLGLKLKEWLASKSLNLEIVHSGEDALQLLLSFEFDLILLDWNLPGMTGLSVCKAYRERGGKSYIIFLTGQGEIENKEKALDAGGDDYLVKPFEVRELFARIKSVMRRSIEINTEKLVIKDVSLDPEARLLSVHGTNVVLTPKECALLEYLMRHANRPFNAQRLLSAVWPSETGASADTVRTWMKNLRTKLATVGKEDFIKTVVSSGYVIESE